MLALDEVESQFRAALRVRPKLELPVVDRVVLLTDRPASESRRMLTPVARFLSVLSPARFEVWSEDLTRGIVPLVDHLAASPPDLIVTYRHLFEANWDLPHSLGTYADVLIQDAPVPVLLLPHPNVPNLALGAMSTARAMVVTDHIVGDTSLVSWGLRLVQRGGVLNLCHVEDDAVYRRYINAISKIPGLDTELATEGIERRLLAEAEAYVVDVRALVEKTFPGIACVPVIRRGHRIQEHLEIINGAEVDVVIANSKDDGQQAMHGTAYSLAIELMRTPLLLL